MTTQLPPAGWYPDPAGGGRLRYFNGSSWTDHYSQPPRQMAAGRQSVIYPGQGGPQEFGAPAGVAPQPAFPGEPRIVRRAGSGRKWLMKGLAVIPAALVLLLFVRDAYAMYAYHVGTPTTATIKQCRLGTRGHYSCDGTWSLGGNSYTGPIETGGTGYRQGSSLDVHVHGGSAYTADAGQDRFAMAGLSVILLVLAAWGLMRLMRIGRHLTHRTESR